MHFSFTKRQVFLIFVDLLCDKWLSVVCYLAGIFGKIMTQSVLQGKGDIAKNDSEINCSSEENNAMERAFWKWVFGNVCIVLWFCCWKLCVPSYRNSYQYTLKTWKQFSNLCGSLMKYFSGFWTRLLKMQKCKNARPSSQSARTTEWC